VEATTSTKSAATEEIHEFSVEVPEKEVEGLRGRIQAARLPGKELVDDLSQGVQLATIQELTGYWAGEYDWRKFEAKLNALPQFVAEIERLDIHFIHVKSDHENAIPLIITHGWPGSIVEMIEVIGPLTDPTALVDLTTIVCEC